MIDSNVDAAESSGAAGNSAYSHRHQRPPKAKSKVPTVKENSATVDFLPVS